MGYYFPNTDLTNAACSQLQPDKIRGRLSMLNLPGLESLSFSHSPFQFDTGSKYSEALLDGLGEITFRFTPSIVRS